MTYLQKENIMNKCKGCGTLIDNNDLCERCFRIKHYNDYKVVSKTNNDFIPILENINKTNDLVLLVVDLFNIDNLSLIRKYLKNDILLVLTKRDLLPKSVSFDKLYNYDYQIDNTNSNLSGGQISKIAIAQAFNSKRDLIIFDETTSNLDSDSEAKILRNIKQNYKDKTIILITHRKSNTEYFNKIITFKDGKIIKFQGG